MNVLTFTAVVGVGSFAAGLLGSLTGMGGGIVVVPMLTVLLGVDLRYAIGASLVSVIATSSGAAAAYVREGITNIRVGMLLEVATTSGALVGAYLAGFIPTNRLAILFGMVLFYAAYRSYAPGKRERTAPAPSAIARKLRLDGEYPVEGRMQPYTVQKVPTGFGIMFGAGVLSALLGIGSGTVKVLAMDQAMRLPFKVSTTTSNFMIGVTAAASAGIYLHRGYIDPGLAFPVMLGVLGGALLGARMLSGANVRSLRFLFTGVVVVLAAEMLYKGLRGTI
jgi:uncharacterized membrane protein YfcA